MKQTQHLNNATAIPRGALRRGSPDTLWRIGYVLGAILWAFIVVYLSILVDIRLWVGSSKSYLLFS